MRRLKKKYSTPFKPFDSERIGAEREILNSFGLKNKRELWRTENELRKYRKLARSFQARENKEQEKIIVEKLIKLGILKEGSGLEDILTLKVGDFLERRLQTVLQRRGAANTVGHARQMIVHGQVKIDGRKVVYPSYTVSKDDETKINVNLVKPVKVVKTETKPEPEKVEENAKEETKQEQGSEVAKPAA